MGTDPPAGQCFHRHRRYHCAPKVDNGEYNNRRSACEEAVRLLQQDLPNIKSLRDVSVDDFNRLSGKLPAEIEKRARHVVEEIERSNQARRCLKRETSKTLAG